MKKRWLFGLVLLVVGLALAGSALAQEKAPAPAKAPVLQPQKITVQGRIFNDPSVGGYYVRGTSPLTGLATMVTVLPLLTQGLQDLGVLVGDDVNFRDILTIEKLDGKPYSGKQEPVFK